MAMDVPNVLKFIVRLMSDPAFRFDVLHKEITVMTDPGPNGGKLTTTQALTFRSLVAKDITDMLLDEAKRAGADVEKTFEILRGAPCDPIGGFGETAQSLEAASMYDEGLIHIRCVDLLGTNPADMWLRAHGLGHSVWIELRLLGSDGNPTGTVVAGTVTDGPRVGDDLFQRVRVQAPLTTGTWRIYAKNAPGDDFDKSTGKPVKTVAIP